MPRLSVRPVPAATVHPLRGKVLRPGHPPEAAHFPGDDAAETIHLAGFLQGAEAPVAVASLYREPPPGEHSADAFRLRGMAVDESLQGQRLGGELLDACMEALRTRGALFLWCNARTSASGFYLSRGFTREGGEEPFDIPGVGPHFQMRRPL